MQRKMEIRFQPDQPVRLGILSDLPQALTAFIVSLNGRNAVLRVPQAVPPGSAIRLDLDDSMLIGEISGCTVAGEEQFEVHLQIKEAIPSMSDLARLVSALMCEGRRESVAERNGAHTASLQ